MDRISLEHLRRPEHPTPPPPHPAAAPEDVRQRTHEGRGAHACYMC